MIDFKEKVTNKDWKSTASLAQKAILKLSEEQHAFRHKTRLHKISIVMFAQKQNEFHFWIKYYDPDIVEFYHLKNAYYLFF